MFYAADRRNVHGLGGVVLNDAIPKRPKLWIFYPRLLQLNLLLLGALACDITNGFDSSMVNGLQALDTWQDYFGNPDGARLGLIATGNRLGQLSSLFFISPLIQKLGRRWPILIGSLIILVGVAIQASAQSYAMFVVGRVILGFGNNIQLVACPILISELAHPHQRPQITAIMNTTGSIGQIMAAWITYGSKQLEPNSWSWRLPSLLQSASSLFQITMVFFMPDSPRWLVVTGREREACRILTKYHAENVEDAEIVRFEMAEIHYTLEADRTACSPWRSWTQGPANRHRLFIVITLSFMMQWCGNAVMSYFLVDMLESIGITNSKSQLIINGCITISGFCFALLWATTIDFWGRRKLFLTGMAGMFCAIVTMTACTGVNESSNFKDHNLSNTGVAMMFLFGAFYKMAGTTTDPYFTEVAPYGLRDKAFVLKQTGDSLANIFSGYVNPIGLEQIGWRYYIVWCCMLVSNFFVIFFFFPETKRLSLEETTQLFDGGEGRKGEEARGRAEIGASSSRMGAPPKITPSNDATHMHFS